MDVQLSGSGGLGFRPWALQVWALENLRWLTCYNGGSRDHLATAYSIQAAEDSCDGSNGTSLNKGARKTAHIVSG